MLQRDCSVAYLLKKKGRNKSEDVEIRPLLVFVDERHLKRFLAFDLLSLKQNGDET